MKGLELSRKYYETYGKEMIEKVCPAAKNRIAVGLVGQGSECLGYDDDISADHDYGPSFCMWLLREDYETYGQILAEAYERLPKDFCGVKGRVVSAQGGGRVGVLCIPDFYYSLCGITDVPKTNREWLWLQESRLNMVTNGAVFEDPLGEFTRIREGLLAYFPEDVRKKKIVSRLAFMAQSGQYNYARLMRRREYVGAQIALGDFIKNTCSVVHLLNKTYVPFYKWMHRSLKDCERLPQVYDMLQELCGVDSNASRAAWEETSPKDYKYSLNMKDMRVVWIETICQQVLLELERQGLAVAVEPFLEAHTMEIMEKIQDPFLRSLPIMEG